MPVERVIPRALLRVRERQRGCPRCSRRGFTLVEALAALMLIAIVLPVAIRAISASARVAADAERRVEALALAEDKLSEVIATRVWQFGDDTGTFDTTRLGEAAADYAWTLTVDDWTVERYRELTVEVAWEQAGRTRTVTLSTVVDPGDVGV